MNDRNGQISRRDALSMALGVGAGLVLRPRDVWAHEAGWDDLQAASLVTKPIPSTGECLPVIGTAISSRRQILPGRASTSMIPDLPGSSSSTGSGPLTGRTAWEAYHRTRSSPSTWALVPHSRIRWPNWPSDQATQSRPGGMRSGRSQPKQHSPTQWRGRL